MNIEGLRDSAYDLSALYPRRLESLTPLQMSLQMQHFLLSWSGLSFGVLTMHLAKKSGSFGLRSNGKAILRKIFSEIVDNLQR